MRYVSVLVLLLASNAVLATDYDMGQCPLTPDCLVTSLPVGTTFSDTFTIHFGNWAESYGTYQYKSVVQLIVLGNRGATPCSGTGCQGQPFDTQITAASLDGVPLEKLAPEEWRVVGTLSPGAHVVTVQGTSSGAPGFAREAVIISGIVYTLKPGPCTGTGGCTDN